VRAIRRARHRPRSIGSTERSSSVCAITIFASWHVEPHQLLKLAEQLAALADSLGIRTSLIGAAALAVHGYERGTRDLDLASNVELDLLSKLERAAQSAGLHTKLRFPDGDDPLGGVLDVGATVDEDGDLVDPIQVVNFANPYRPRRTPAANAIARAEPLPGSTLRCVQLRDLIALKLWAHSLRDDADVVELLKRNPTADRDAIRATAAEYKLAERFDELVAIASSERR
jgi:hypothetical protein